MGWVRHAFDRFEIPFDLIFKERVREGDLRADYDVVLIPNQGRTAKGLVFDVESRGGPRAYTKTDRYRFLGDYGSSEDITGGMGIEGVLELQRFVGGGGLLVTLGAASYVPPEYGLTREIDARRPGSGFYAPARWSKRRSNSRAIRSSTATTRRRRRCATPTDRSSRSRAGSATTGC